MGILRESKELFRWDEALEYIPSVYNISQTDGSRTALFNTASGAVAVVSEKGLSAEQWDEGEKETLVRNGFLVPVQTDEFEAYRAKLTFAPKQNINFFTIIPTTACNAHCFYCYEKDYCAESITEASHRKIVNYLAGEIRNRDEFVLDWYGGEPLLCVDEIDRIITELGREVNLSEKHWTSSITTNATLFDRALVSHAVSEWHLDAAHITIDGTEQDHNRRKAVSIKSGSAFARTRNAIGLLLEHGVYVNLRVHMDHNNRKDFPQILKTIQPFFEYPRFHLFPTFLFPPEFEMPESYIADDRKEDFLFEVCRALSNPAYHMTVTEQFPQPKTQNCFATKSNTVVIAPDSSLHACVQEFEGESHLDRKFQDYSDYCYECRHCPYFPICLGGCIHNRSLKGTVRTPCVRNRFLIRPLLQLLLEQISGGNKPETVHFLPEDNGWLNRGGL